MQKFCLLVTVAACLCLSSGQSYGVTYRKATEGKEVVKNKLYPKRKKVEISVPNLGIVMNQSYEYLPCRWWLYLLLVRIMGCIC